MKLETPLRNSIKSYRSAIYEALLLNCAVGDAAEPRRRTTAARCPTAVSREGKLRRAQFQRIQHSPLILSAGPPSRGDVKNAAFRPIRAAVREIIAKNRGESKVSPVTQNNTIFVISMTGCTLHVYTKVRRQHHAELLGRQFATVNRYTQK